MTMDTILLDRPRQRRDNGGMARKKTSGKHKVPRQPVQFPKDWLRVARMMAAERRQPVQWFLLSLVEEKAKAEGKDVPEHAPWSEQEEE